MENLEECLSILEEDVDIHVSWKEWNVKYAEHIKVCTACQRTQRVAGDEAWHDQWIEKYSMIIDTLKEIRETTSV